MKYDLNKKPNRGASRTLKAFFNSLIDEISKKSFEEVTVNDLCDKAGYPRATFYNYFHDKYDLLDYCFAYMSQLIKLNEIYMSPDTKDLSVYFSRLYDLLTYNRSVLSRVLEHNPSDGWMMGQFKNYINTKMIDLFNKFLTPEDNHVPLKLLAKHYGNTFLLLLEDIFLYKANYSKEKALSYLNYLLTFDTSKK